MAKVTRVVRGRWTGLGIVVAAAVAVLTALPVFGTGGPDADHLRLIPGTQAFFYGANTPGSASVVQPVTVGSSGCEISPLSGSLVTLSSNKAGPIKNPGLFDNGIGVKSGGSNGTPCSQVDGLEKLIVASAGHKWFKARLDVEVKGGVWVMVELWNGPTSNPANKVATHELLTGASITAYNAVNDPDKIPAPGPPYMATTMGTGGASAVAACADPNDSGPDANLKDNCLWSIEPGVNFDRLVIYAKNGVGSVSLEGGNDYLGMSPAGVAAGDYDTLFYRALAPQNDSYSTDEDTTLNVAAPGVLANDGTSGATVLVATGPSHGSLTLNSDGSFSYTPAVNYNGLDSFTYTATTGVQTDNATVTITVSPVNDPPVASGTPLAATEDTQRTITGADLATDVDGDALIISAASATGSATLNNGVVTYDPVANFCGSDTLSFTVSDGNGGTVSGSVTINIACVNDAPVAGDDSYDVDERDTPNSVLTTSVAVPGVLGNDTDADTGDTLTASGVTGAGGTVVLNSDGSFDYTPALLTDQQWDALPNSIQYVDSWDYTVSDGNGGSDTGTVNVTVHRVICSGETVTDIDGNTSGSFTLLSQLSKCKRYEVDADNTAQTVTFTPGGGESAFFRGMLSFDPQALSAGGTFTLGLQYDPDNEGPEGYRTLQVCLNPVFDAGGLIISADFPVALDLPGGFETWCFGGELSQASNTVPGEIVTVYQVYGTEDPAFSKR